MKQTKKKHPRERKIHTLSEEITSKRFQKAQDRPKNVTLLSKLKSDAPDSGVSSPLPAEPPQPGSTTELGETCGNLRARCPSHTEQGTHRAKERRGETWKETERGLHPARSVVEGRYLSGGVC